MATKHFPWRRWVILFVCIGLIGIATVLGLDAHVRHIGASRLITPQQAAALTEVDCILVPGCQVKDNGEPGNMLADRLSHGVELYTLGAAPKLLMSGDHGQEDYNEVVVMKAYATQRGVPSADVFMDHAGFSTYESLYRAKEIFHADKLLIVSQEYHLYRALYIAEQLGIDAYGVAADDHVYAGQWVRDIREILARVKDVISCAVHATPTYLGDAIPISGNGDLTND